MKKLKFIFLGIFILVGILTYQLSKGGLLNAFLKPYLETVAMQVLKLDVSIESLDISILKRSLVASNVKITSLKKEKKINILLPEVSASLQLYQLFLGKIAIKDVILTSPHIDISLSKTAAQKKQIIQKISFPFAWNPILDFNFKNILIKEAQMKLAKDTLFFESQSSNVQIKRKSRGVYALDIAFTKNDFKNKALRLQIQKAEIKGEFRAPFEIKGTLTTQHITLNKEEISNFSTQFSIHDQALSISKLSLHSKYGDFLADGKFFFNANLDFLHGSATVNQNSFLISRKTQNQEKSFVAESSLFNLETFFGPSKKLDGSGNIKIEIYPQSKKGAIYARLDLKNVRYQGIYLGDVSSSLQKKDPHYELSATFQHASKKARGEFFFSNGRGGLSVRDFQFLDENFVLVSTNFYQQEKNTTFENIHIQKQIGQMQGHGKITGFQNVQFELVSQNLKLESFNRLPHFLQGDVHANFSVFGPLQAPKAKLEATGENIVLTSTLELKDNFPYTLDLKLNDLNYAPALSRWHEKFLDVHGRISGHSKIQGTLKDKKISKGNIQITHLSLSGKQYAFHVEKQIVLEIQNNRYALSPFRLLGTQTNLKIEGSLQANQNISFLLDGPINLQILNILVPAIEKSSGEAKIFAKIEGNKNAPILFGNFMTTGAELEVRHFPSRIENIQATLGFSQNKVSIDKFTGLIGGGAVQLQGDVIFPKNLPAQFDVTAQLTETALQYPSWLYSNVSGEVSLAGETRPYQIKGNLFIHEALYKENIDWQSQILRVRKQRYIPKAQDAQKPLYQLDISLHAPKNIHVQNNIALLEAGGDLQLTGNPRGLTLQGELTLLKGNAYFKNNTFELKSAHLKFNDPNEINPEFFIHSESTLKDYRITMQLEGRLTDYKMTLSSAPALADEDIVSLLTLGAIRADLESQSLIDVTSLELGSFLFGGVGQEIEQETQKSLGVTFRLSPSYSDTKHATVPRLLISRRLGQKADVVFSSTLDRSTIFADKEFNVKYYLNKNFSVVGFWEDLSDEELQDNASLGVDIKAQIEFQ